MEKTCGYSKARANCQDSSSSSHISAMQAMKKRKRAAPHSHYKRRRDNKINKRLRVLRNLIPNCTQMDKESVLDEAIVYLKCLQLQLQIMPSFGGLCVPATPIQLFGLPLGGYGTMAQQP
uniref:Basic helix-loop-helix transcription factor n=1 Tax=Salvia miltiorrhiza TaxID=226208 RepID=A0A0H3YBW9_SALMI|nr:basic helix-loop-helix transcription factor [Salvia miltiorrhiza]